MKCTGVAGRAFSDGEFTCRKPRDFVVTIEKLLRGRMIVARMKC